LHTFQGHGGCVVFSPDGKRLASAGFITEGVRVWDAQTGQEVLTLKGGGRDTRIYGTSFRIAFSPDGQRLATGGGGSEEGDGNGVAGGVKVWDAQTGRKLLDLKLNRPGLYGVAYSPDGKRLAGNLGEELKVWDAQTGQELLA